VYDYSSVLQFKLTVVDSSPEIFRRVLVPDFTLESFHYVISYSFGWLDGFEHWFSQGELTYGPRDKHAPTYREYEHTVYLTRLFRHPGDDMKYVFRFRDVWRVDIEFEGDQGAVPGGRYPCCVDGDVGAPPDGVGGILRYNKAVDAFDTPEAWGDLLAKLPPLKRLEPRINPWELDLDRVNHAAAPPIDGSGVVTPRPKAPAHSPVLAC